MNEYFTKDAFVSDFTDKSNELVFMNIKKHVTITMLRKNRQCKQPDFLANGADLIDRRET